ncbi:MAG: hypothetical protein KF686_05515 [Ramlibacter sp.]|nr:hypothetical protein [Ramlibacter sp.]
MLHSAPDYELETFQDVQIDRETATLVKAGIKLDDRAFLLPADEHPWHMGSTHSYCVLIDLPDNRRMVIPCLELIRFYFGSSSPLLAKLFLPPLERDSLYSHATFDRRTALLKLNLAEGMFGRSAADIGRIYGCQRAWSAAAMVGASMLKASIAGKSIHPQSWFPFEGKSTLVAAGKWLTFGGRERSTFLVYNLRSCSHPLPFQSLFYEEALSSSMRRSAPRGAKTGVATPPRNSSRSEFPSKLSFVDQDASSSLAPQKLEVRTESRFPDLIPKNVCRMRMLEAKSQRERFATSGEPVSDAAVGEPGSSRRVRSVDVALFMSGPQTALGDVPEFLDEVVDEVGLLREFLSIKLLTESQRDGWTTDITVLHDVDGVIDASLFIESEGGSRLRRASLFEVRHAGARVCAVVIEAKPPYVRLHPIADDEEASLWATLRNAAENFMKCTHDTKSESLYELVCQHFNVRSFEDTLRKVPMEDFHLQAEDQLLR